MQENELKRIRTLAQDPSEQDFITLGYLIHDVARQLKRSFDENVRRHGITLPQWRALRQLLIQDELSQAGLACQIDSDPMTVSRMIDRMEAAGLVERRPDPNDSRAKLVRVTPEAHGLFNRIRSVTMTVFEQALDGVGGDERAHLLGMLNRISDNLGSERAETKGQGE